MPININTADYAIALEDRVDLEAKFNNLDSFVTEIERLVSEHQLNYIDATIAFAERSGIELEFLGELIRKDVRLLSRLQKCGEEMKFLKPVRRLAI